MRVTVLDVGFSRRKAKLWLKDLDSGNIRTLEADYKPYFLVLKRDAVKLVGLLILEGVEWEELEAKLFPRGRGKFYKITFESASLYRRALHRAKEAGATLYSSDVRDEHKVLAELGAIPLAPYRLSGGKLIPIEDMRVEPLPLKVMSLSLTLNHGTLKASYYASGVREKFEASLEDGARELEKAIRRHDPDVVAVSDMKALRRLAKIAADNLSRFGLGRVRSRNPGRALEGRAFVDALLLHRIGIAGLEERCRFTGLSPRAAASLTYGRMVDMRQVYILLNRCYAVPPARNLNVTVRTALEIHREDRGGIIIQPAPGVYENVAALDFESMFPNLIIKYNISYETVTRRHVKKRPRGLLVDVVEPALKRRLYFKKLRKKLPEPYRTWAQQRQAELKMLLVSCYGYSGNNYNRLGNPLTFNWINRIARRVMTQVIRHARKRGYRVIYGDTDSIFLTRTGATAKDYEELAAELRSLTGLPIKVDKIYKFLAFPADKTGTGASALKRYFGRLADGELDIKGIEAARNDVPTYIRKFQENLIDMLLDGENLEDVYGNMEKCLDYVRSNVEAVLKRKVKASELIIRKVIRKESYKSKAPHYIAAQQLRNTEVGTEVRYIYVAARSPNPYRRIRTRQQPDQSYDAEKYVEMLLSAAETVLSCIKVPKGENSEKHVFNSNFYRLRLHMKKY